MEYPLALGSVVLVIWCVERGEMQSQHCNESVSFVICLTQNLSATCTQEKKIYHILKQI